MIHWIAEHMGLDNLSGTYYGFWSGIGSDLGEVTLLAAVVGLWRAHACHVNHCWRIGHRKVPGTDHIACRRHHPTDAPTHAEMLDDHDQARR